MIIRRAATRRADEGIANAGVHDNQAPSQENQVPPLEQVPMGDQVLVIPPPLVN